MSRWRAPRILPSLLLLTALALPAETSACPNCKETVARQSGDGARMADGYNYSILFMMAMPLAMFGAGAFCVVRAARRGDLPPL